MFLFRNLEEEIFMDISYGFKGEFKNENENMCKLKQSLYGLK